MGEVTLTVTASVVSSVSVSALLMFAVRTAITQRIQSLIQHEYNQKLETHKSQLQAESTLQLENLKSRLQVDAAKATETIKSELQRQSTEHQIRFSRWHERVADTAADVFAQLYHLHNAFNIFISPSLGTTNKAERREAAMKAVTNFRNLFDPRSIYLPRDVRERILGFWWQLWEVTRDYDAGTDGNLREEKINSLNKAWNEMSHTIPSLMRELEDELQALLTGQPIRSAKQMPSE